MEKNPITNKSRYWYTKKAVMCQTHSLGVNDPLLDYIELVFRSKDLGGSQKLGD